VLEVPVVPGAREALARVPVVARVVAP
jgi:hypothetical protein